MNELQKSVIIAFIESGMSAEKTAQAMNYCSNNIKYHLEHIKKQTGLNPRNFFDLNRLYEMATGKEIAMPKMTLKQAIDYLQPIADNAQLNGYREALTLALDAMREVEELRKELADERYRHDRYVDYAVERDKMIDELRGVQGDG